MHLHRLPELLDEPIYQQQLITNVLNSLYFLDDACSDILMASIEKPSNLLFESLCSHPLDLNFYNSSQVPPTDKSHILSLCKSGVPVINFQKVSPFFTNSTDSSRSGDPIVNPFFYYHTFKCAQIDDLDAQQSLNEQINWVIPGEEGRYDESEHVLDRVYDYLSKYDDFLGLYCTYSGNKSLHIHTEWRTLYLDVRGWYSLLYVKPEKHVKLLLNEYETPENAIKGKRLRQGLVHCWDILADEISLIIRNYRNREVKFDQALREPDAYRRLSWGTRSVNNDNEFFARGSTVRQLELWAYPRRSERLKFADVFADKTDMLHDRKIFLSYPHDN